MKDSQTFNSKIASNKFRGVISLAAESLILTRPNSVGEIYCLQVKCFNLQSASAFTGATEKHGWCSVLLVFLTRIRLFAQKKRVSLFPFIWCWVSVLTEKTLILVFQSLFRHFFLLSLYFLLVLPLSFCCLCISVFLSCTRCLFLSLPLSLSLFLSLPLSLSLSLSLMQESPSFSVPFSFLPASFFLSPFLSLSLVFLFLSLPHCGSWGA